MSENFRPNVCGKYALQGSSRALYTTLDPTHKECTWPVPFKRLGMLCWLEAESSRMVSCGLVGWSELVVWIGGGVVIWWSDLVVGSGRWSVVVFGCGGLIWVNCDLIVWCGGLIDWFHGLIWRCAWGTWSGLTAEIEKIRSWVNSRKTRLN